MTISKNLTRELLDLLQRGASQLEGDYGRQDGLATEMRDMHSKILGFGEAKPAPTNPAKSAASAKSAMNRHRDANGHFV